MKVAQENFLITNFYGFKNAVAITEAPVLSSK